MKSIKQAIQLSPKPITKKKPSNSQLQYDITALKTENLKLQKQIAKLKAEQVSLWNKIIILEKNTDERCVHEKPPYDCLIKKREILQQELKQLESKKR